jgi:hypothetical protein
MTPMLATTNAPVLSRQIRAGLWTGVSDGLFACILSVWIFHSTVTRLFQGVASVLIGAGAYTGGTQTALLGVLMHFGVAQAWSLAFGFIFLRAAWVRKVLASPYGVLKIAALYGPMIWLTMSLIVIPVMTQRAPGITSRWWIQLVGHIPFVGVPIAGITKRLAR